MTYDCIVWYTEGMIYGNFLPVASFSCSESGRKLSM